MAARFGVLKNQTGSFHFVVVAPNAEQIAVSEGYTTKSAAGSGVASVEGWGARGGEHRRHTPPERLA